MSEHRRMERYLEKGTVLQDRYVIEEFIGEGGFGLTYRARDRRVDVPVAVKEYLPQRQMTRKEALRETKMAAKFYGMEGIAAARDFFAEGEHVYIIMEYVEGMSVKQYIGEHGRMNGEEALQKMRPIIEAVGKIHREGVIHRDISADNLMLNEEGKLKLVDFGTARFTEEYVGRPHTLIFKRGFAPIEQCRTRGDQGPWTDIYALCATIYFMITGMVPDDSVERIIDDRLKSLYQIQGTGLSEHQMACIMKGLAIQPEDRYQTIAQLQTALYGEEQPEALVDLKSKNRKERMYTTGFRTTALFREIRKRGTKNRKRTGGEIAAVTLLLLVGLAIGLSFFNKGKEKAKTSDVTVSHYTDSPSPSPEQDKTDTIGNYIGLTRRKADKATTALRKAGLRIIYQKKYSAKGKKGKIISQKPVAGTEYKEGEERSLVLVVSRGKKPHPTPTAVVTVTPTAVPARKPDKRTQQDIDFSGDLDSIPD